MKLEPKIFGDLFKEVIKPGFCTGCGACVATCQFDSLAFTDHEPKPIGKCEKCSFCYYQCPQTGDSENLTTPIFGEVFRDPEIGVCRGALSVKTKDPKIRKRCQDGGAVTSILTSLLAQDFIDAAVLMASRGNSWKPEPKVALTGDEIIGCAGAKYTQSPALLGLRDAVDLHLKEKIAIVGTPCQIKALRRMQHGEMAFHHLADRVKLLIGLFCMESFDYEKLKKFVGGELETPFEKVSKFDIKKGKFVVYSGRKKRGVEVKILKDCVNTCCTLCPDFTSELADISVGAVGSPLGRSMVLLRTGLGAEAFDVARNDPKLDVKSLDLVEPVIKSVRRISRRKKDSAKKEVRDRITRGEPIPFGRILVA